MRDDGLAVHLEAGPIHFAHSVPLVTYDPPAARMTLAEQRVELPADSYLVMEIEGSRIDPQLVLSDASLRVSEIVALFNLRYDQIIAERVFEGAINKGNAGVFVQEGPFTLTAQPSREASEIVGQLTSDLRSVASLTAERRNRFRLGARWYRRGHGSVNPIDKFLSLWTALEVYPGEGDPDVVGLVVGLLSSVYPDVPREELKARIGIGRIAGLRGDIVHQGKAFVARDDEESFSDHLKRLAAIAATCLRMLASLEAGTDLDPFVRPN